MPFGKYHRLNVKMRDVPAEYLHWLWFSGKRYEYNCPVHRYIHDMQPVLEKENPDLFWE